MTQARLVAVVMSMALALGAWCQHVFPAFNDEGRALYQVDITMSQASVSGVCVIKCEGDTLRGTIVNEFGIPAFSFWVSPDRRKVKLRDVMPMLNKWYIKRVIKGDLKHLFNTTTQQAGVERKHRRVDVEPQDGAVTLTNTRRNLIYHFEPMTDDDHAITQ